MFQAMIATRITFQIFTQIALIEHALFYLTSLTDSIMPLFIIMSFFSRETLLTIKVLTHITINDTIQTKIFETNFTERNIIRVQFNGICGQSKFDLALFGNWLILSMVLHKLHLITVVQIKFI